MSFGQFLSILRARKWAALAVFGLVVATTLGISLLLPQQYLGVATVVVDVKPDPVSATALPVTALPSFMATQVDILTSERVALQVIRDLNLTEVEELREKWQRETNGEGTVEQWLLRVMQKQLDVKPSRESNVISVSYKAGDARFAAAAANAFARAYIATTLSLRAEPARQYTSFFSDQARAARESLEQAQKRLSDFQRMKGLTATDERLDVETSRLNELSSQLVQLQSIAAGSVSREMAARGEQAERTQEVLNSPMVVQLKADLARNEAKLQELSARYGGNHPQVLETRAGSAEVRRRLEAEIGRIAGGAAVTSSVDRQREARVRQELEAQRAKVLQLKAVRDEGQVLVREVESAQRNFDTVMGRQVQTAMESQTTQSYASVLTPALPPVEPDSPRVLLNTALAVFLGALLAVGVALSLEHGDRRLRSPTDVVTALSLPVLGVVPGPGARRYVPGRQWLPAAPAVPFLSQDA